MVGTRPYPLRKKVQYEYSVQVVPVRVDDLWDWRGWVHRAEVDHAAFTYDAEVVHVVNGVEVLGNILFSA